MEKAKMLGFMLDVFDDAVIPKAVESTVDIDTSTDILDQLREAHRTYLEEGIVYVISSNVSYFYGNRVWFMKVVDELKGSYDTKGVLI